MNIDRFLYLPNGTCQQWSKLNGVYTLMNSKFKQKIYIVYYHGNATNCSESLELVKELSKASSVGYIIPEYPGYCEIPYDSITKGIHKDVDNMAEWIIKHKVSVNIIGQSIGTGPACRLAEKLYGTKSLLSLQLISPYYNISRLVNDYTWLLGYVVENSYDNAECLSKINGCPINIIHGSRDHIIGSYHAENLYQVADKNYCKLYIIDGLDHNDIYCTQTLTIISNFILIPN